MGFVLGMLIAVTSAIPISSPVLTNFPDSTPSDIEIIDYVLFELDLNTFIRQRPKLRRSLPQLNWTTDGCSAPVVGESGRSFNFRNACIRHDFGYRNYKSRELFTADSRLRLDEQFRQDLHTLCAPKLRTFKIRCAAWAEIFYAAVRSAGGP